MNILKKLFCSSYVKEIEKLRHINTDLRCELDTLHNRIKRINDSKENGTRLCDNFCPYCIHSLFLPENSYICELDCKCKDFDRKLKK